MSLAQTEVAKRRSVRAMLERLRPEGQDAVEDSLHTRQELFGKFSSRAEEGFHQRCLTRLCAMGVLDSLVAVPTRTRVYAVRDSSKVLDALTDDEALTRFIWHRPEVEALKKPLESEPQESEPPVTEGVHTASTLLEMASKSDEGVQAVTLKLLAGMVDSLYYLRIKIEGLEQKLDAMAQRT